MFDEMVCPTYGRLIVNCPCEDCRDIRRGWDIARPLVLAYNHTDEQIRALEAQGETMLSPEVFHDPTIAKDSGQCREWLDRVFTYHAPEGDEAINYIYIRDTARHLAEVILDKCPPSDDRDSALRAIRAAVMWANASIATRVRPQLSQPSAPAVSDGIERDPRKRAHALTCDQKHDLLTGCNSNGPPRYRGGNEPEAAGQQKPGGTT